tara:strand:- start:643 stop:930 length:288 start_codon:yes stop_codon:yes gene_type:complete
MIFQNLKLSEQQEKIVLVLAAYGIVQVLAQDLGIKTGKKQRDLVQKMPVQIALLFAGAYTVTNDVELAVYTTAIYYGLKFIYSKGETSAVCFEDV